MRISNEQANAIADAVADYIWKVGADCGEEDVRRIAFKHGGGTSKANERESGGLCHKAFRDYVRMAIVFMGNTE